MVKKLKGKTFDLILCVESLHCFSEIEDVFSGAQKLLNEQTGYFVVADIFEEKSIARTESLMNEYFSIEKKEIITINVKHAMNLDKERVENIVASRSSSYLT